MGDPKHIGDLNPDSENRRKRTSRNVGMIVDALQEVGAARSIVIDENNTVLAGNGVLEAAAEAGLEKVKVVEADGSTIIAVRRAGLTDEQKRDLAIFDNRTAELAEWDTDQLRADLENGLPLDKFFRDDELAEILDAAPPDDDDPVDGPVAPAGDVNVKPGDVWTLGDHTLVCGDSTDPEEWGLPYNVNGSCRAMWTDPPYGVNYKDDAIQNDDASDLVELLHGAFAVADEILEPGSGIYVARPPGENAAIFLAQFLGAGWKIHEELIWVKDALVLGHSDYHLRHESIIYGWKQGAPHRFTTERTHDSVFEYPKPNSSPDHPTPKPLEMVIEQVRNSTDVNDWVYDPFSGSGTTLMACDNTARRCLAVEINPSFCQVIINRWEAATGSEAVKESV